MVKGIFILSDYRKAQLRWMDEKSNQLKQADLEHVDGMQTYLRRWGYL
jgi:hypothetical protein